jgi:hypothetical protein
MKKLLLILLILTASLTAISQSHVITTYANQKAHWSEDTEEWVYTNWKYADIKFLIKEKIVVVYDKANSLYTKTSTITEDSNHRMWDVVDERNQLCLFLMTIIPDQDDIWYITVMYNTVLYRYAYIKN